VLTISLWLLSFVCIALTSTKTKHWNARVMRVLFSVMVGLSFWTTSVFIFWLIGFDLQVGTIKDGKMNDHWWLPLAVVFWTVLTYYVSRNKT
tara:strand:- start:2920 stop:3195 length:276 start_codon:yes stop_codon:yes gene_type:complete